MNTRHFELKLHSLYTGNENLIKDLVIDVLRDGKWEPLDLNIHSPGFLLYINALFSCQHLYMRTNSAESDIELESADGTLLIDTDNTWHIQKIRVHFIAKIRRGTPNPDKLEYITQRMYHCPVSTNLPPGVDMKSSVEYR